jgi:hypothetical protein
MYDHDGKRTCDECGKQMSEGYSIEGVIHYCSEECLHKHFTPAEWEEAYADGEGDCYWTDWTECDEEDNPDIDTYHAWDCEGDNT